MKLHYVHLTNKSRYKKTDVNVLRVSLNYHHDLTCTSGNYEIFRSHSRAHQLAIL